MAKVLNNLIESKLAEYTLNDKTKALVMESLVNSQGYLSQCDATEKELRAQIAADRAAISHKVGLLRKTQSNKVTEIDAVKEIIQLLTPRKIQ